MNLTLIANGCETKQGLGTRAGREKKLPPATVFQVGVVSLLLLLEMAVASAVEFEVDGVMSINSRSYGILPSRQMHISYHDCKWSILQMRETTTNRWVLELSDDGEYIYQTSHVERKVAASLVDNSSNRQPNSLTAQIFRKSFPDRILAPEIVMLFYAYAASCYLDSRTNQWLDPIKFQPHDLDRGDQCVKAFISRNPDSLRLPRAIWFLYADHDRTNAILEASNFTNLGTFQIPSKVVLTRFASSDQKPLVVFDFQVNGIQGKCNPDSFRPGLPEGAYVEDHRFSRGQALVPPVVHGRVSSGWPTEENSKSKPSYRATQLNWEKIQQLSELRKMTPRRSPAFVRVMLLLVALCGALSILILKSYNAKHQKEQENQHTKMKGNDEI